MIRLKKIFAIATLVAMLFVVGCDAQGTTPDDGNAQNPTQEKLDTTDAIAVVNGELIPMLSFDISYKIHEKAYKESGGEAYFDSKVGDETLREALKREVVETLVENTLIRQYVQSTGYEVDPADVDQTMAQFEVLLSQNPETKAFYEEIGITDDYLKSEIKISIYREAFERMVMESVENSEKELSDLYASYVVSVKASHILVSDLELASDIKAQIDGGSAFEDLVAEYSEDVGSISDGGSLGYFSRGDMSAEFESVAFSMSVGEISQPVETQYGFHIIKLEDSKTIDDMIEAGEAEEKIDSYKNTVKALLFDQYNEKKVNALESEGDVVTFLEKVMTSTED